MSEYFSQKKPQCVETPKKQSSYNIDGNVLTDKKPHYIGKPKLQSSFDMNGDAVLDDDVELSESLTNYLHNREEYNHEIGNKIWKCMQNKVVTIPEKN